MYLNIHFGLLQLEVVFFAPALFRLHHWSQSVELDKTVIENPVAVVIKSDTHLERFSCKPIRNDQWVFLAADFSIGEQPRLTLSRLKDQLAISTSQSTTRDTGVIDAGSWKNGCNSPHFCWTILIKWNGLEITMINFLFDWNQVVTWIWTETVKGWP